MTTELGIYAATDLEVSRPPDIVLEEARRAAVALHDVFLNKKKPVIMNGEPYLEFEDWQTVGRFYGVTAKVESTQPVSYGSVSGFEASAVAINVKTGEVISRAEAMCLNDEEKWASKPKYDYVYVWKDGNVSTDEPPREQIKWIPNPRKPGKSMPQKDRIKVAEEPVPLFQLRSMAQTRACAKVLRQVFGWVVVLAGYKATPAEEIEDMIDASYTLADDAPPQKIQQQNGGITNIGDLLTRAGKLTPPMDRAAVARSLNIKVAELVTIQDLNDAWERVVAAHGAKNPPTEERESLEDLKAKAGVVCEEKGYDMVVEFGIFTDAEGIGEPGSEKEYDQWQRFLKVSGKWPMAGEQGAFDEPEHPARKG